MKLNNLALATLVLGLASTANAGLFEADLSTAELMVVVGSPSAAGIAGALPYIDLGANLYTGTVQLQVDGYRYCSGSLLSSGRHILTAAHCVTNEDGSMPASFAGHSIQFDGPSGSEDISFAGVVAHEGWTYDYTGTGNDLAIVTLSSAAPEWATRYDLYNGDAVGLDYTRIGYGSFGFGDTGAIYGGIGSTDNLLRVFGSNHFDVGNAELCYMFGAHCGGGGVLGSDFDSLIDTDGDGIGDHDLFGHLFNDFDGGNLSYVHGATAMEVNSAPGDSGGTLLVNGQLAGITSWGWTVGCYVDASCPEGKPTNSSWGELAVDTSVAFHYDWINAHAIPVPAPLALMGLSLLALGLVRRRR